MEAEPTKTTRTKAVTGVGIAEPAAPAVSLWRSAGNIQTRSTEWLGDNAISLGCGVIAGGGVLFALTMSGGNAAATDYSKKWLLFLAPLVGIIGGCWGGRHASWKNKLGLVLIVALITAFPLHAAAIDTSNTLGGRLAAVAVGGSLTMWGCVALTTNERGHMVGGVVIWAWVVGWILFVFFAPREIGLPAAGSAYGNGNGVTFNGAAVLCFLLIAGAMLWLWLLRCHGGIGSGQYAEQKTTITAHTRPATRHDLRRLGIISDDDGN